MPVTLKKALHIDPDARKYTKLDQKFNSKWDGWIKA